MYMMCCGFRGICCLALLGGMNEGREMQTEGEGRKERRHICDWMEGKDWKNGRKKGRRY